MSVDQTGFEQHRITDGMLMRTCRECACTDEDACYNDDTDESCGWIETDGEPLCTFCAIENHGYEPPPFPNLERAGFVLP